MSVFRLSRHNTRTPRYRFPILSWSGGLTRLRKIAPEFRVFHPLGSLRRRFSAIWCVVVAWHSFRTPFSRARPPLPADFFDLWCRFARLLKNNVFDMTRDRCQLRFCWYTWIFSNVKLWHGAQTTVDFADKVALGARSLYLRTMELRFSPTTKCLSMNSGTPYLLNHQSDRLKQGILYF